MRFPVRARGYFGAEVDALVAKVEATLKQDAREITAQEVRAARFDVVLRGYDMKRVDDVLSEYVRELEAAERGDGDPYAEKVTGQVDWLIGWVSDAEFGVTRITPGYDEREVDDFLDRVIAGLRGEAPAVSGEDARSVLFRSVRFGVGYNEREVDRFLDQLAGALDHLRG